MSLYVDNLKRFENNIVVIDVPGNGVIQGIMTEDSFTVSTSAQIDDALATGAIKAAKGALTEFLGMIPGAGGYLKAKADRRLNPLSKSAQGWVKGSNLEFSVSFKVFKRGTHAVGSVKSYGDLQRVMAAITQTKSEANEAFQQPAYYDIEKFEKSLLNNTFNQNNKNLISIGVGKYFKASGLLGTSATVEYSTRTDKEGNPLFATVSATFQTYRDLNFKETAGLVIR